MSRPDPCDGGALTGSLAGELVEQRLALALAQTAQPAARGDLQTLHDLLRADLADARHGLQQRRDLHLAEHLVRVGLLEHLREAGAPALEPLLELGPGTAGGGGPLPRPPPPPPPPPRG